MLVDLLHLEDERVVRRAQGVRGRVGVRQHAQLRQWHVGRAGEPLRVVLEDAREVVRGRCGELSHGRDIAVLVLGDGEERPDVRVELGYGRRRGGVAVLVPIIVIALSAVPVLHGEEVVLGAEDVSLGEREELRADLHAQHVAHGLVDDAQDLGREHGVAERAVRVGVVGEYLHERATHGVRLRLAAPLVWAAVRADAHQREHRVREVAHVAGGVARPVDVGEDDAAANAAGVLVPQAAELVRAEHADHRLGLSGAAPHDGHGRHAVGEGARARLPVERPQAVLAHEALEVLVLRAVEDEAVEDGAHGVRLDGLGAPPGDAVDHLEHGRD